MVERYHTVCPNCSNLINTIKDSYTKEYKAWCTECGYSYILYVAKSEANIANDLGRYKFICIDKPYGALSINSYARGIINFTTTFDDVDSILHELRSNTDEIESAMLSYYCKEDHRIKQVDLMQFL